ncbi:hypothetical protein FACUT_1297 [Fusarium acutatum]|uniref:Uncharacterized protein n=1 Tax=Fusarium acutatum TaxID=78861 RepID=A0A8H4K4C0_9HYPO|nr:hypothetical protein FACUT_1297 [Fusarium acutatum]
MPDWIDNVDSNLEGPRYIATWPSGEHTFSGLIEWMTARPETLEQCLAAVRERLPTDENRPEEARTLVFDHFFNYGPRIALVYKYVEQPIDLRDAITPSPEVYQHPEYQAGKPLWSDHVWSLMMVLSEIAEWKPLEKEIQDHAELRSRKLERKRLVTSPGWKDAMTAEFFQFGFGFLEKDRSTLEEYSHWKFKRFYDGLCKLLDPL